MNRRTALAGTAGLLALALAGCLGGTGGSDGGTETETDQTETEGETDGTGTHPRFTETSLTRLDDCRSPGEASAAFDDEGVTVVGCVVGKNGCTVPVLDDVSYDAENELVTLVVAAVEERDEDEACTEALVHLGYEVRVELDGTVPSAAAVVHDDVNGRRTVTRAER